MKVSEKSLELNVGAELLTWLRGPMHMPKAYLRGLTQRDENKSGVDFFAQLPSDTRIFAFQFKAPRGPRDNSPYKFTLNREQHGHLLQLATQTPNAVFYVLPFYVLTDKLIRDVPHLARDTWFLPVAPMDVTTVFSGQKTKRVHCHPGRAYVNPEYEMRNLLDVMLSWEDGIEPSYFADWYQELRRHNQETNDRKSRMSPMIVRGLRVALIRQNGRGEIEF